MIHAVEPDNAPMLYSGVGTEYDAAGNMREAHPVWRPHLLQVTVL